MYFYENKCMIIKLLKPYIFFNVMLQLFTAIRKCEGSVANFFLLQWWWRNSIASFQCMIISLFVKLISVWQMKCNSILLCCFYVTSFVTGRYTYSTTEVYSLVNLHTNPFNTIRYTAQWFLTSFLYSNPITDSLTYLKKWKRGLYFIPKIPLDIKVKYYEYLQLKGYCEKNRAE